MTKTELIISEHRKPFYLRFFVASLYTAFIPFVMYLYRINVFDRAVNLYGFIVYVLVLFLSLLVLTFPLISIHRICLNFLELKIKHEFAIGPFIIRERWQKLNKMEYISIFKKNEYFFVNMWYEQNNILNLFNDKEFKNAFEKGFIFADRLNIDLLDATIKGDFKWVNKEVYKKTKTIEYF